VALWKAGLRAQQAVAAAGQGLAQCSPYGFEVVICVSVVQGSVSAVLEHQASVLDKQQQSYTTRLASTVSPAATAAAAAAAVDQPSRQQQQELTANTRRRKADRVSARTSSALQAGQQQLSGQVYGSSSGSGLAAAAAADSNSSGALVQQQQPEPSTRRRSRSPSSAGGAAAAVVDAAIEDAEHRDSDLAAATTESQQPSAAAAAGDVSRGAGGHPARMSVVWDMAQVMVPFADAVLEPPRTVSGFKVLKCGLLKSTVSPLGIKRRYCFERGETGVYFKRNMKSERCCDCNLHIERQSLQSVAYTGLCSAP
jgi:hypothetical protein